MHDCGLLLHFGCTSNSSVPGGNPRLHRHCTVITRWLVRNAGVRPTNVLEVENTHPLGAWVWSWNEESLLNTSYLHLQPSLTSQGTGEAEALALQGCTRIQGLGILLQRLRKGSSRAGTAEHSPAKPPFLQRPTSAPSLLKQQLTVTQPRTRGKCWFQLRVKQRKHKLF